MRANFYCFVIRSMQIRIAVFAGLLAIGFCGCAEAPVLRAVKAGNLSEVQTAFAQGTVNKEPLQQAMCRAAASGRDDILKVLIANGAAVDDEVIVNQSTNHHHKGLCPCADGEPTKIARFQTPLMCAAKFGRAETAEFLLAAGADINAHNGYYRVMDMPFECGYTPLTFAAAQGHENVVKILLAHEADATIPRTYKGTMISGFLPSGTAAELARENGHEEIAQLIEDEVPDAPDGPQKRWAGMGTLPGQTPFSGGLDLGEASEGLHLFNQIAGFVPGLSAVTSVTGRMERGVHVAQTGQSAYQAVHPTPDPDAVGETADTAAAPTPQPEPDLHVAAEKGDILKLKLMLSKGADVRERCAGNETALHHAALRGHDDAVSALVAAGAEVDAKDDDGVTPLLAASLMAHDDTMKLLIAAKADPNLGDKDGWTPLMAASTAGNAAVVNELIAAKADPNVQSLKGDTALSLARKNHADDVAAILVQAGAKD